MNDLRRDIVLRFRQAGFSTRAIYALMDEGLERPEELLSERWRNHRFDKHRMNVGAVTQAEIERYIGKGWKLTETALLRSSAAPVFLHPRHWPRRTWQCWS